MNFGVLWPHTNPLDSGGDHPKMDESGLLTMIIRNSKC
jgi:hypothetical protein